jgi:hypothetical protein
MSDTLTLYGCLPSVLSSKKVDWVGDTAIKAMLCSSAYAPNQDSHVSKADVTGEVTGAGYTARGKALVNKTATYDPATNKWAYDADDVTWTGSTITARRLVAYLDSGTDATSPLLFWVLFGTDVDAVNGADRTSTGGPFTEQWNPAGIFAAQV